MTGPPRSISAASRSERKREVHHPINLHVRARRQLQPFGAGRSCAASGDAVDQHPSKALAGQAWNIELTHPRHAIGQDSELEQRQAVDPSRGIDQHRFER